MTTTTLPRKYEHREAMRRMGSRSKIDRIIDRTFKEFDKKNKALFKWKDYILKNLEKYRAQINEKMESDGTMVKSLVLIRQDGLAKVYIAIRVTLKIDSRGELALAKIREFLDEYQTQAAADDPNIALMIELLSGLFTQRRKELVVTQGLLSFTKLEPRKIPDPRLREAWKILKEAITAEESGPIVKLYVREDNKWQPYKTPEDGR